MRYSVRRSIMETEFEWMEQCCLKENKSYEMIEEIHRVSLDELNNDRKYEKHNSSLNAMHSSGKEALDESWSPLYKNHLERLSVCQPEISEWGRYDWIDDLDTPEIIMWAKELSDKDMEIITYLIEGRLKKREIANVLGCSPSLISKFLKRARGELGEILSRN